MSRTELLVGDPTPAFPPAEFLKGVPFAAFEPGHVYVVECWATWCGPCRQTIPHLTQMQKDHPDVRFVGIAVWEWDIEAVRAFVADQGDAMGYAVALDVPDSAGSGGWMADRWLTPAYQFGIPAAFIVDRQGRIAWIGHPAVMHEVLPSVADGSFDLQAATERYAAWIRESMTREKTDLAAAVRSRLKADDLVGAVLAYDDAFAECPRLETEEGPERLRLILRGEGAGTEAYGRYLLATYGSDFPHLKRAVASVIAEVLELNADRPERQALAGLLIDIVSHLEAEKPEDENAYQACIRARYRAVAFLAEDRPSDALRQAEAALAHGRTANLREGAIKQLLSLAERCAGRAAAERPKTPTFVCEGDACRIV
ncbi:TlpA family protein disulfide reductase [Methylorubrum thiocyanatum]